jgi:hypothetical protein
MLDLNPRIVVEISAVDTGRITRALKKKREKARAFSSAAAKECLGIDNLKSGVETTYLFRHLQQKNSMHGPYRTLL